MFGLKNNFGFSFSLKRLLGISGAKIVLLEKLEYLQQMVASKEK
jgi:hypothetical protein